MRSVRRAALLIAALLLPIAVVLVSYVLTEEPRAPQVPTEVRIGSSPGPAPEPLTTAPTHEPTDLPPPPPDDDDDDEDDGPDDDGPDDD